MARKKIEQDTESAKERLIEAGLYLFANHGVEGVRTRILAEKAGVNQSAIPYYFGGKEGVYAAVIAKITDELVAGFRSAGQQENAESFSGNNAQRVCVEQLRAVIKGFTRGLLLPGRSVERTMLIVREQLQPTESFDTLFNHFIEPLHKLICSLIAKLQDRAADDIVVITQAHALVGQTLAFAVARQAFLRRIDKKTIDETQIDQISEIVASMAISVVLKLEIE